MKPEDVQACATGCCLYLNGEPVSKEDFEAAQSLGETRIPCLRNEQTKRAAKEARLYISVGVVGRLSDKGLPIYDSVTHQYLQNATPTNIAKWKAANDKI